LICEDDIAFRAEFQEQLIESIPGMREARIAAGHSPFVGKSMQLARKLVEIVEDTV
jgi:GR25 family glycosyltransferase involved in LPS biosynthesis